ncbi:sulfate/thiosulfate transport system ATP-binding protein [Marchantia polymorpha subsp. ruderalis]|uniref:ABC transporter domain-containing protein n=2 Tax=Marchantia polymorpha TaxID=3197 RepID=A0AAF6BU34_MARPO|nr:hypothetical protein MARPO_0045s0044 [Marchantia polymorpha]BBN15518.1 hypothetical protein Mp_6g20200 [Marchantia polymorpha subsp. ruderalis]|eukprot:PTQ39371.1 hypothetical protein MARPO_0045s0044 [Marchantia polymorpha]
MAHGSVGRILFANPIADVAGRHSLSFNEGTQVSGRECSRVVLSSARPAEWTRQNASRRSVESNGIFSNLKSNLLTRFKGGNQQSTSDKKPPIWPPAQDADESDQELTEEDDKPYVPEVNKDAELDESVLKEIASKGATEVRVVDVDKVFLTSQGMKRVVKNVSLRVEAGQLVALVGPSGSGKTTLLRMIAGLEPTSAGKVYFNDEDLTDVHVQDRDVGFMFQSYALFKHMTVAANVGYGLSTSKRRGKLTPEQIKKRVDDLLSLVQLSEYGDRFPPQLSGGQRQRVALARALATEPRLLLLDEPFGALDIVVRQELRTWVKKLQKALNITTIFVTHDQDEALEMADYMVVFHRGRILQEGAPFEIYERPNSAFVMNFISDPNVIPATCLAVRRSGYRTTKPYVLVRPDDVTIFYEEKLDLPTTPATVLEVNNMGPEVLCEIKYDDGVTLEFNRQRYDFEDQPLEVGQRVHLQLKPLMLKGFSPEDLKA